MSQELPADSTPQPIEASLAAYAPRPPRIDRDRLMFEAGRAAAFSHFPVGKGSPFAHGGVGWMPAPAAGSSSQWLWPVSTAIMTMVACGLAAALFLQIEPVPRVQVIKRVVREPHVPHQPQPAAESMLVSSDRSRQLETFPEAAAPAEEAPVLTLAGLPENHILRVRQVALTQGIEALSSPSGESSGRLAPPPTRASLMRKVAPTPAATSSSPALFRWSFWSLAE